MPINVMFRSGLVSLVALIHQSSISEWNPELNSKRFELSLDWITEMELIELSKPDQTRLGRWSMKSQKHSYEPNLQRGVSLVKIFFVKIDGQLYRKNGKL